MSTPNEAIKAALRQYLDDPENPAIKQYGPTIKGREMKMALEYIEVLEGAPAPCRWRIKPADAPIAGSECGHEFWFDDFADPPSGWMKFCPFCGGRAEFVEDAEGK